MCGRVEAGAKVEAAAVEEVAGTLRTRDREQSAVVGGSWGQSWGVRVGPGASEASEPYV